MEYRNHGQTVPHKLQRGGVMELKIVNHVWLNGQEYLFSELSEEEKEKISVSIQTNAMMTVGFREKKN